MSQSLDTIAETRRHLWEAGFRPVPIHNWDAKGPSPGKRPLGDNWRESALKDPPFCTTIPPVAFALNTGILADGLRAIDIDIDDPELALRVRAMVIARFGEAPIRVRHNSARSLVLYAAAAGQPRKTEIVGRSHTKENACKVEVLGAGQQFVAFGRHDSGADLEWTTQPGDIVRPNLLAITEAELLAFLTEAAAIINAPPPGMSNGQDHEPGDPQAEPLRVAAALAAIPNTGPANWEAWNRVGMALWAATGGSAFGGDLFDTWSRRNPAYNAKITAKRWEDYPNSPPTKIGAGSLFHMAGGTFHPETPLGEPPDWVNDPTPITEPPSKPDERKPALQLAYGWDALQARPLGTIVEGLLHAGSITLVYGPPKSGKSFLVTDLALAITDENRSDWMGHDIVRHGPVLYVACEGHAGFWKRLTAAAQANGWDRDTYPKGFILATGRPMLIRAETRGLTYAPDPSSIIEALADARQRGLDPVAIVIDTVFRSFGVGNVNASPDMNVYLSSVTVLIDQGYAVALVHHEIKAGGTPAGSVSLIGGADTIVHVWPENETRALRFFQVEMAKDDAETEPRAFTLEIVPVGLDPEGRPVSSCIVHDAGASQQPTKKRGRPVSGNSETAILAALILDELYNLMADPREGEDVLMHPESPPIRAIARGRLRASIKKAGILDAEDGNGNETERQRDVKANNQRIQRAITMLKRQEKIICDDVWVGLR